MGHSLPKQKIINCTKDKIYPFYWKWGNACTPNSKHHKHQACHVICSFSVDCPIVLLSYCPIFWSLYHQVIRWFNIQAKIWLAISTYTPTHSQHHWCEQQQQQQQCNLLGCCILHLGDYYCDLPLCVCRGSCIIKGHKGLPCRCARLSAFMVFVARFFELDSRSQQACCRPLWAPFAWSHWLLAGCA